MLDRTEDRTAAREPVAGSQLRSFVQRINAIEDDIKERNEDKSEVYKEAKAAGFDVPALKAVIAKGRKDPEKLSAHEAIVQIYENELGPNFALRAGVRARGED